MATHPDGVRNNMVNGVVDQLDSGTTNATGQLVFRTSGDVEVATLNFSNPAFGDSASGVATAAAIADDTNATGGTTDRATWEDRDNNTIVNVTVGTSGAEINLSSTTISVGDTVRITALTYTGPN